MLSSGRFTLGLGAGENLNEHVIGGGWPMARVRQERLAEAAVREEDVTALVPCGPDVGAYVEAAREWADAGFTHLALVQVGAGELLPALREL